MLELSDKNFKKEVLESKTPVLVGFWRPGCSACSSLSFLFEEVEREVKSKAKVGKLNIWENPIIAKEFKIPAVPTLIIFKNGKAEEKAIGLRSKEILIKKLSS